MILSIIQEAEHVPHIDMCEKTWTNTSQLWSMRWARMIVEEKGLYHTQAENDE